MELERCQLAYLRLEKIQTHATIPGTGTGDWDPPVEPVLVTFTLRRGEKLRRLVGRGEDDRGTGSGHHVPMPSEQSLTQSLVEPRAKETVFNARKKICMLKEYFFHRGEYTGLG